MLGIDGNTIAIMAILNQPDGLSIAWDYCLERELTLPMCDTLCPDYLVPRGRCRRSLTDHSGTRDGLAREWSYAGSNQPNFDIGFPNSRSGSRSRVFTERPAIP